MKKSLVILILLSASIGHGQGFYDLMDQDVKSQRKAIAERYITLSDEEAELVWPIYNQYLSELEPLLLEWRKDLEEFMEKGKELNESTADRIAQEYFIYERSRLNLKEKYYSIFQNQVSATAAVKIIQIDNRIEKMVDIQIMGEVPLAEGEDN